MLSRLDTPGIRLLPLAGLLPRLRTGPDGTGSGLEAVTVPAGAYRGTPEVATIGVANLLLCRPDLPVPVADALTRVLVRRATRLVPTTALGTQFLDVRSLISTGAVPLHSGAIAAYRELHGQGVLWGRTTITRVAQVLCAGPERADAPCGFGLSVSWCRWRGSR